MHAGEVGNQPLTFFACDLPGSVRIGVFGEHRHRGGGHRNGRGDRIRTYDPWTPRPVRYQTAPRPDTLQGDAPSLAMPAYQGQNDRARQSASA